jgi:hypothetical protein
MVVELRELHGSGAIRESHKVENAFMTLESQIQPANYRRFSEAVA